MATELASKLQVGSEVERELVVQVVELRVAVARIEKLLDEAESEDHTPRND